MAVSQKLADHLRSLKHSSAIQALKAKVDAVETSGFKGEHMNIRRAIFDELVKIMPGQVEWVEPYFLRGEITIETYTDYSKERNEDGSYPTKEEPSMTYGWRGGEYRFIGVLKGFHPHVSIKSEYTGSMWHSKPNGKVSITMGDFGAKELFKQRKDGSHRYNDIAISIKRSAEGHLFRIKQERARINNQDAVQVVVNGLDHEFKNYSGVYLNASSSADAPITIKLDKTLFLTSERAIELLNVLKKFNIG